ncbi:hypothetical protein JXA32_15105 [Candidatus Sumerlaeota bacterium]|nr:hypothetical protein [Candidatus Sumerlaeota bacterium]
MKNGIGILAAAAAFLVVTSADSVWGIFETEKKEVILVTSEGMTRKAVKNRDHEHDSLNHPRTSIEAARSQGRKIWVNRQAMQMAIVDSKINTDRVYEYYYSVPELKRQRLSQALYMTKYANSREAADQLNATLSAERIGTAGRNYRFR